jgi:hypothetical protein
MVNPLPKNNVVSLVPLLLVKNLKGKSMPRKKSERSVARKALKVLKKKVAKSKSPLPAPIFESGTRKVFSDGRRHYINQKTGK